MILEEESYTDYKHDANQDLKPTPAKQANSQAPKTNDEFLTAYDKNDELSIKMIESKYPISCWSFAFDQQLV